VHTKETMPVFYFSWENTGAQLPWQPITDDAESIQTDPPFPR
jgi:hypothetical protein